MNLKPISAGLIFALAMFHPAAASDVPNAEALAQCATATPQPTAQRPLDLRSALSLACPIDQTQYSQRIAETEQNFSRARSCAATIPMPRLATVIE
jgi:hypothetical protein